MTSAVGNWAVEEDEFCADIGMTVGNYNDNRCYGIDMFGALQLFLYSTFSGDDGNLKHSEL